MNDWLTIEHDLSLISPSLHPNVTLHSDVVSFDSFFCDASLRRDKQQELCPRTTMRIQSHHPWHSLRKEILDKHSLCSKYSYQPISRKAVAVKPNLGIIPNLISIGFCFLKVSFLSFVFLLYKLKIKWTLSLGLGRIKHYIINVKHLTQSLTNGRRETNVHCFLPSQLLKVDTVQSGWGLAAKTCWMPKRKMYFKI